MATNTTQKNVTKNNMEDEKILRLEKENAEIKQQLKELLEVLKATKDDTKEELKEVKKVEEYSDIPEEPAPNKMIRVLSLCRGSLNLSEDETGRGKVKFSKYGEIKPILYSSLINIVNYNRKFAEKGLFYILDKASVYYLGLNNAYNHLVTNDVLDNICEYNDIDIEKIIDSTESSQIDTMVKNLIDRIYAGESVDLNKVKIISNKTGVDILSKVNEMKSFSNLK